MPLGLFRLRNVAVANVVGVLWAAAMFAWFFLSALYMQLVLGYGPMQVGARVPAVEPDHGRVLARPFGEDGDALRHPLAAVRRIGARGRGPAAVRARAGRRHASMADVLPGMLLLGLGAGMAFNPVLLAAMSDVGPEDSGSRRASSTRRS